MRLDIADALRHRARWKGDGRRRCIWCFSLQDVEPANKALRGSFVLRLDTHLQRSELLFETSKGISIASLVWLIFLSSTVGILGEKVYDDYDCSLFRVANQEKDGVHTGWLPR